LRVLIVDEDLVDLSTKLILAACTIGDCMGIVLMLGKTELFSPFNVHISFLFYSCACY